MLQTHWTLKRSHLYLFEQVPSSKYYYIGDWKKEFKDDPGLNGDPNDPDDLEDRMRPIRKSMKNCWRRFKPFAERFGTLGNWNDDENDDMDRILRCNRIFRDGA